MTKQTFTTGQVLTAAQMTSLQQTAMGGGSTTAKTASYTLVATDAGTVVQMNSASSTTITVNTALFAAGDTVQIQNVGAGVCTVTAGTATVSTAGSLALSQYEGGQLYFNTTSASLFFDIVQSSGMTNPMTTTGDIIYSSSGSTPARLGIGSSAQVLTVASGVPSWATPAGGGGKVLQVVSAVYNTKTDSSSATYADSGLTATITPTLATSTILVCWGMDYRKDQLNANNAIGFKLFRAATNIVTSLSLGFSGTAITMIGTYAGTFKDSPATTSATTYKIQFNSDNGTATVTTIPYGANSLGSIVLMEIGA